MNLDRYPSKDDLLRLLKSWFAAAREKLSSHRPEYLYALARAIRVMTKAGTAEDAIFELQRLQAGARIGSSREQLPIGGRGKSVYNAVFAHIEEAARAVRVRDIDAFVCCLEAAIGVYEANPKEAQKQGSQLPILFAFVASAQSICETRHRPAANLLLLEARAEALRAPHH